MLPIPAFSLNASSQEQSSSQEQYRYLLAGWPPLTVLRAMCEALHEGLAAHRKYEALRSKGIPHDGALRQALAIGPPLSWVTRDKRSVSDKEHVRCARPAYVGH